MTVTESKISRTCSRECLNLKSNFTDSGQFLNLKKNKQRHFNVRITNHSWLSLLWQKKTRLKFCKHLRSLITREIFLIYPRCILHQMTTSFQWYFLMIIVRIWSSNYQFKLIGYKQKNIYRKFSHKDACTYIGWYLI